MQENRKHPFGAVLFSALDSLAGAILLHGTHIAFYEETHSVAQSALLTFWIALPQVVFGPYSGWFADSRSKRQVLVWCQIVIGGMSAASIGMDSIGWNGLLVRALVGASAATAQLFRLSAAVGLVEIASGERYRSQMNGLFFGLQSTTQIVAPVLAAVLYTQFSYEGVAVGALCASLGSVVYLSVAGSLREVHVAQPSGYARRDLLKSIRLMWTKSGLISLVVYFLFLNTAAFIYLALLRPYVLSFSDPSTFALVWAASGGGALLAGAFALWRRGGSNQLEIARNGILSGCVICWSGATTNVAIVGFCAAAYGYLMCVATGISQTLWQERLPLEHQGRVFALRRWIAFGTNPIAALLAVGIVNSWSKPSLEKYGYLVAKVWPRGEVGATGLAITTSGIVIVLLSLAFYVWIVMKPDSRTRE